MVSNNSCLQITVIILDHTKLIKTPQSSSFSSSSSDSPFISLFLLAIFAHPILSTKNFQAFDFLQQLDECHIKGQTVKCIHELKQYLRKFGYLDVYKNHTKHEDDDEFDDILESTIKTYQLNYHLQATRKLDAQTVKQMRMPRCGVPDIVNGKTSMRSGKKHTKEGKRSLLHSVSHFSFFQGSPRWPVSKSHLTYQFSYTIPVIGLKSLKTVTSRAFARWAYVSHFIFSESVDHEAYIVIGYYSGDHGDGSSFDGPGGMLAHYFSPTDGRLHYDADDNWSTNPGKNMMDLEAVATHEIGHLLRLEHSSEPNAIMYPTILFGSLKRKLHGDDVQGIRAVYGHLA